MQYTKPMIELVYEIRRLVSSDMKPSVKLANPELFNELKSFYLGKNASAVSKALIKELFNLAGDQWQQNLEDGEVNPKGLLQSKLYRGVASLEEKPAKESQHSSAKQKKMVYRGQVVA